MIKFVNAKINIGLNILRKREDGYHELETLFYPVGKYNGTPENPEPFCDILEIGEAESGEDEFSFSSNYIDCPIEKNLVYRAVKKIKEAAGIDKALKISLDKHIPDGAGLGGGSADAAFTLMVINEMFGTQLSKEHLLSLASTIGADCPFFIENRPVIATGIGEIMSPAQLDLTGCWCVIVKPDIFVSTREAFAGIKPEQPAVKIEEIIRYPMEEWEERGLKNDFEKTIFHLHPQLNEIKEKLKECGAAYTAMSGSGSSIYGLFKNKETAADATVSFGKENKIFLCKL